MLGFLKGLMLTWAAKVVVRTRHPAAARKTICVRFMVVSLEPAVEGCRDYTGGPRVWLGSCPLEVRRGSAQKEDPKQRLTMGGRRAVRCLCKERSPHPAAATTVGRTHS